MGLSSALAIAMSGLSANQASLSIVSSNIANAQTPGYVTQNPNLTEIQSGTYGSSVQVTGVNRELDLFVQSQLRTETSGGAYADQMANILNQLQSVYGTPGGQGTLETALSNFTSALQAISTSSGSSSSQSAALAAAQNLAQSLNSTTQGIQSLRTNVNQDIGNCVNQANAAMTTIANINSQLQGMSPTDPTAATLEDQRDSAINTLSQLMDIRTVTSGNQINVFTNEGVQLVSSGLASTMAFSSPGSLTANSLYNTDPSKSGVGSLTIQLPNGTATDLVASQGISSGQIAADLNLRDNVLVQAQTQVDQLAATLSSSLSDTTTAGTAVAGPPAGFSLDTSDMLAGNTINLTYTDATNTQRQIQIVNVSDSSVLPLPNAPNANPQVIGVNFSDGMTSVVSQLNTALSAAGLHFSNSSGSTLTVAGVGATVNAASTTTTATQLQDGSPALPLFTDGNSLYTGAVTAGGSQMTGYAGRITVNPALLNNPSALSIYNTSPQTAAGDTTRSDYLFNQLTTATFSYSPQTGLGSAASPFNGTVTSFLQQFISQQGAAATQATNLQQGQDVVVSTLQQKFNSTSGVNIDTEMSNLIQLQNAYAANAHVMSVVQSMMNTLLQAQV
ncbi:MAG TPA: flagellar hook-associated protein FlgK [Bradyrhizobium sp.]|nr:flagellar hook-associated protein FlgK [Bradyrhizobium sp.]